MVEMDEGPTTEKKEELPVFGRFRTYTTQNPKGPWSYESKSYQVESKNGALGNRPTISRVYY